MLFRELTPASYENHVQNYVTTQGAIQLLNAAVSGIHIHHWPLIGIYIYVYRYTDTDVYRYIYTNMT
jgi:hypothetical protein